MLSELRADSSGIAYDARGGTSMSNAAVQDILEQIGLLSEQERLYLATRLAETSEADWRREVENARRIAHEKGIDQAAVDRASAEVRYPA